MAKDPHLADPHLEDPHTLDPHFVGESDGESPPEEQLYLDTLTLEQFINMSLVQFDELLLTEPVDPPPVVNVLQRFVGSYNNAMTVGAFR